MVTKWRLILTPPDAFEELFWSEYLENYNGGEFCKIIIPRNI